MQSCAMRTEGLAKGTNTSHNSRIRVREASKEKSRNGVLDRAQDGQIGT